MEEKKANHFDDLGLGQNNSPMGFRALNKDGSFNVKKYNVNFFERVNFFHSLISMSWPKFIFIIISGYFVVNSFFATIYYAIGIEHLTGIQANSTFDQFIEAFFFSAQTVTTLGYGRIAPIGYAANTVAAAESMLGLLSFALATGILYGRFSKPTAKLKYSNFSVVSPYNDINAFMFRIVNPQSNQLLDARVTVSLSMRKKGSEGRNFFSLDLERSNVTFLPYTWTIVHPITKNSPLYNTNAAQVKDKDAEFIIMIKAFDESSSQTVYSKSSYKASEIKWGEKFIPIAQPKNGRMEIDVSQLDKTKKMNLN